MKTQITLILLGFNFAVLFAQPLDDIYKKWKRGEVITAELNDYFSSSFISLNKIGSDLSEADESQRQFFYYCIKKEIDFTNDPLLQQRDVNFLVNNGLIDNSPAIVYQNLITLLSFPSDYFSQISVNKISGYVITDEIVHRKHFIRLSGQLNSVDLLPYYKQQILKSKNKELVWSMRIAMAKMNDKSQIDYCFNILKNRGLSDETIFYLVPDLLYISNREVVAYLLNQILLDNKNCTSTNPDHEIAINCAFRLMELLAPYIHDYPLVIGVSGDIISTDYEESLATLRNWILENIQTFQLL